MNLSIEFLPAPPGGGGLFSHGKNSLPYLPYTGAGRRSPTFDNIYVTVLVRSRIMITEHWVSVEDAAQHLGVARDSIYRWIEAKGLPAHKIGRLWKFKLSEVDQWVRTGGAGEGLHESSYKVQ